ncbi:MAG: trypsin-like peptidase domain-containing protein [Oscillospiraceae bacterium]|nr:trypsin-like peptidase domain-containing protein [Oscillospiraceae bacterium]
MTCNNCRTPLALGARFCPKCGATQNAAPPPSHNAPAGGVYHRPPPPPQQQFAPPPQQQPPPPSPQQYTPPQPKKSKASCGLIFGIIAGILTLGGIGIAALVVFVLPGILEPETPTLPTINHGTLPWESPGVSLPNNDNTSPGEFLTASQIYSQNKDAIFQVYVYQSGQHVGFGSGFFVSESGIAVTNHHVLDGATSAKVVMEDGSEYNIIGYYSYELLGNDVAVFQVDGRGNTFNALSVGNSDAVQIGDSIYAIGGPEGDPLTITDGIISRFATELVRFDGYAIEGMLQHTAAIYGGNSGGPLLNNRGEVIGINAAGRSDRASVQFAIPINYVTFPASNAPLYSLPIGSGSPQQPPPPTQPPQIPQQPGDAGIVGTWLCNCSSQEWWCLMSFKADGRFTDYDNDSGTFRIVGNFLEVDFDEYGDFSLRYALSGDEMTLEGHRLVRQIDSVTPNPNLPQPPANADIIGQWQCFDPPETHGWFCGLTFNANGRFTDRDGDNGTYTIFGNSLTLVFAFGSEFTFGFELGGNTLNLYNDGILLATLMR